MPERGGGRNAEQTKEGRKLEGEEEGLEGLEDEMRFLQRRYRRSRRGGREGGCTVTEVARAGESRL